jgi:hypothetical protein
MVPQEETQIANEQQEAKEVFKDLLNHLEISSNIDEDKTELVLEVTELDV